MRTLPNRHRLLAISAIFSCFIITSTAHSDAKQELVVFLSLEAQHNAGVSNDPLDTSETIPTADIVYSYASNRFRILSEYVWSSKEKELERLQFGWELGEETIIWLGRFHRPSSYWNTAYHHGQYLQTSITRPGIEDFEDDGGPLPAHTTGLLLETGYILKDHSGFQGSIGAGLGPELESGGLEPFDIFDVEDGHHLTFNLKLGYLPNYFEENQFGVLAGRSNINVEADDKLPHSLTELKSIDQVNIGVFADWRIKDLRIISSIIRVKNQLDHTSRSSTDYFTAGYLQADYKLHPDWTAYGRFEETHGDTGSDYLLIFSDFVSNRTMLGIRYDFTNQHALTLEISDSETTTYGFGQFILQWSAVLP